MRKLLLTFAPLALLGACITPPELAHAPWSQIGAGTNTVGMSTGWALYGADVSAEGVSGVLVPGGVPDVGKDNVDLTPRYGGAIKYGHFITDDFLLGAIVELRSFDPDTVKPLSATLAPDPFETWHFLVQSRYYFPPFENHPRLKPFIGFDWAYIPSVTFDNITVTYPAVTGIPNENISAKGDSYMTIAPVIGMTYLWNDNLTVDMGAFYEFPIDESEDIASFANLGGSEARVRVEPEGLIAAIGISYYF